MAHNHNKKRAKLNDLNKNGGSKNNRKKESSKKKRGGVPVSQDLMQEGNRIQSEEEKYLNDYQKAITTTEKRPFSLRAFGQGHRNDSWINNNYEIKKAEYLSNPKNLPKLVQICNDYLYRMFGNAGKDIYDYSIPSGFKSKNLPPYCPSFTRDPKKPEVYVFTHSDEFLNGILKARKIPITEWEVEENSVAESTKARRYLLNVDGQILLGEVAITTCKAHDHIEKSAKSRINFSIYFRGREDGKIMIAGADYKPMSEHLNKFDEDGNLKMEGIRIPHTNFSHIHIFTLHDRLVLTQNGAVDVCPAPINEYTLPGEEELRYETFGAMITDMENYLNLGPIAIPNKEIAKTSLKDIGKKYCPEYNTVEQQEFFPEVDIEGKLCPGMEPFTQIQGNDQVRWDTKKLAEQGYLLSVGCDGEDFDSVPEECDESLGQCGDDAESKSTQQDTDGGQSQ